MLAPTDIDKREDLAEVFPWLALSPKPFDEMAGDALDAVASASSQGYITEAEAEVLFREILAAWVSRQTMDLVSPLFENMSSPSPVRERRFLP